MTGAGRLASEEQFAARRRLKYFAVDFAVAVHPRTKERISTYNNNLGGSR